MLSIVIFVPDSGHITDHDPASGNACGPPDVPAVRTHEDVSAAYENGVLKLTMPKKQETLPTSRKLEIA